MLWTREGGPKKKKKNLNFWRKKEFEEKEKYRVPSWCKHGYCWGQSATAFESLRPCVAQVTVNDRNSISIHTRGPFQKQQGSQRRIVRLAFGELLIHVCCCSCCHGSRRLLVLPLPPPPHLLTLLWCADVSKFGSWKPEKVCEQESQMHVQIPSVFWHLHTIPSHPIPLNSFLPFWH